MSDDNLTVRVLIEIRDELRGTNQRLDQTNARLDQANERLDQTNERLDQVRTDLKEELFAAEVRSATQMTALIGSSRDVADLLRDRFDLRDRVERCEREIEALKKRAD